MKPSQYDGRGYDPPHEVAEDIKSREIAEAVAAERERLLEVCADLSLLYRSDDHHAVIDAVIKAIQEPRS